MDATAKPFRIPPQIAIYAEKHEIFDLVQTLVQKLMVDKPDDPIQYLINLLKRGTIQVPRIMLLGPPASGKTTIARNLCEQIQAIHINTSNLLLEDTDQTMQALQYRDKQQEIPSDLWIKLIQQRLSKIDCVRRGWIMEGIPRTHQEALSLQKAGIFPDHVVMLKAPDSVLKERSHGKRIDPVTGDVYHVTFIWPEAEEVAERLLPEESTSTEQRARQLRQHQSEAHALARIYHNHLKTVDADQPHADVLDQVLTYVLSRHRSLAPHTPRILLFGPPGSGKSLQAKLISQKYNMVNLCCEELLKAVSADETNMGELIKPFLQAGQRVPDSMVLQVLTERLSRLDCTLLGWVLHGFPRDLEQAEKLQESNFIPSRVFFLEMTEDVALERLTLRSIDPVSGERYHAVYQPAPSPKVQARLQTNPSDSKTQILQRCREYWATVPALQHLYPDAIRINADQDPQTVFESLESRLVGRLPNIPAGPGQGEN